MATAASLNLSVTANMAAFRRAMGEAQESISVFTVAAGELIAKGVEMGISLGEHAVMGIAEYVKGSIDAIDVSSKLADRLGISTTSLMGFEAAAHHAGVEAGSLATDLQHMMKTIGEADITEKTSKGGKHKAAITTDTDNQQAQTFARLKIPLNEIQNMHADQAFMRIVDAIKNIKNPMEQAYLTTKVFGRSGMELLPILREGSEGLKNTTANALKLGTALSEIDVQQVELAKNSFRELDATIHGASNKLAVELAPFLSEVTHRVIDFANAHGGLAKMATDAFESVLHGLARMADYLEMAKAVWYGLRASVNIVVDAIVQGLEFGAKQIENFVNTILWAMNEALKAANYLGAEFKLFSRVDLTSGLEQVHIGMQRIINEDVKELNKHWDKFQEGVNSKAVTQWVQDVRDGALTAAQSLVDAKKARDDAMAPLEHFQKDADKKTGGGVLSLTHAVSIGQAEVEGLKNRSTANPADKMVSEQQKTNALLQGISNKSMVAVAG